MRLLILLAASLPAFGTTVVLNGVTYTLQSHPSRLALNGASGALTTAMSDTGNRAQSSNPAYQALVNQMTTHAWLLACMLDRSEYLLRLQLLDGWTRL